MKRYKFWLMIILVIVLTRVEHTGIRIDQLQPVETILLKQDEEAVMIETDTGAKGTGVNLQKALENLNASSDAKVFLDTTRYLIVTNKTEHLAEQMYGVIRPNTLVCRFRGDANLEELTQYLKIHSVEVRLMDLYEDKKEIPTLYYKEGRGQLVE